MILKFRFVARNRHFGFRKGNAMADVLIELAIGVALIVVDKLLDKFVD